MLKDQVDQAADDPSFVPASFEREFEELEVTIGAGATAEVDETLTTVLSTLDALAVAGVFPPVADSSSARTA